jgi:hypothetical protein
LVLISVNRLSRLQGHSASGRVKSMENFSEAIGNRTVDLPAYSAVKTEQSLLYSEKSVCFVMDAEYRSAMCGWNIEFCKLHLVVHR